MAHTGRVRDFHPTILGVTKMFDAFGTVNSFVEWLQVLLLILKIMAALLALIKAFTGKTAR